MYIHTLTGKKWMHTGVVTLTHMDASLLAWVVHTALASGIDLHDEVGAPLFYSCTRVSLLNACICVILHKGHELDALDANVVFSGPDQIMIKS